MNGLERTDAPGSPVHPQFETEAQQRNAATLGMWLFLGTEVLFFGGLFLSYTYLRWVDSAVVLESSRHLEIVLGSINTAVLLTSSFLMALGVMYAEEGRLRESGILLALTAAMGIVFLAIKGTEYSRVIAEGLLPGYNAHLHPVAQPGPAVLFFWLYFVMTGLHALHVLIGAVLLGYLALLLLRRRGVSTNTVRNAGLYWHFVDMVWVFIFPLLYLAAHR